MHGGEESREGKREGTKREREEWGGKEGKEGVCEGDGDVERERGKHTPFEDSFFINRVLL